MMRVLWSLMVIFLIIGLAGSTPIYSPLPAYAADPNDLCTLLPGGYEFVGGSPDSKGVYPPVKGSADKCSFSLKDSKKMAFGGVGLSGSIEKTSANVNVSGIIANMNRGVANPVTGPVPGLGDYSRETSFKKDTADWYVIAFFRGQYTVWLGQTFYPGFTDQRAMVKPIAQAIDQNLKSLVAPPAPTAVPTVPKPPPAPGCSVSAVPIDCAPSDFSTLRVSVQEAADIACFRYKAGGNLADVNNSVIQDILALARSRGGTGTVKCGYNAGQVAPLDPPTPTLPLAPSDNPPEPATTQEAVSNCDALIAELRAFEKEKLDLFVEITKSMGYMIGIQGINAEEFHLEDEQWITDVLIRQVVNEELKLVLNEWELARNIRMVAEEVKARGESCQ